jgi:hypothetical protein
MKLKSRFDKHLEAMEPAFFAACKRITAVIEEKAPMTDVIKLSSMHVTNFRGLASAASHDQALQVIVARFNENVKNEKDKLLLE